MISVLSRLLLFSCISLLLFSCSDTDIKPSSSGKPGELLIVADSTIWKSEAGKILRDSLVTGYPGLPQHEPMFRVVQVPPSGFKNLLQQHRNVLILETGPLQGNKNYSLTFKNDVFATPQLVMNLRASDLNWLESASLLMSGTLVSRFTEEERKRAIEAFKLTREVQITRDVVKHIGITLPLTDDYYIAVKEKGYSWIRKETIHMSHGIQLYRFLYTAGSSFNVESIIALRDSLSKQHVPGPSKGSYMTTDKMYPLTFEKTEVNGKYAIQVRGLWRTEGDFMGGPFISFLIHDESSNELIFADAFIYAPRFNKREYVKSMEALIRSMKF